MVGAVAAVGTTLCTLFAGLKAVQEMAPERFNSSRSILDLNIARTEKARTLGKSLASVA